MDPADINRLWHEMNEARQKWADAAVEHDRAMKLFADLEGSSDGAQALKNAMAFHANAWREYITAAKLYTEAIKNRSED